MPDPDNPSPSTHPPHQPNPRPPRKKRDTPALTSRSKPPTGPSDGGTQQHASQHSNLTDDDPSPIPHRGPRRPSKDNASPRRHQASNAHTSPSGSNGHSTPTDRIDGRQLHHRPNRRNFGSRLTTTDPNPNTSRGTAAESDTTQTGEAALPKDASLTSRLIAAFSRSAPPSDALDCPICFNTIGPGQPTWSCSQNLNDGVSHGTNCWATFHLKCIRSWASKSFSETRAAYLARGVDQPGEWRCPGCQTKRHVVPTDYYCFCGRTMNPKPGRLSTPHSCGDSCSRRRLQCDHPCPLSCHPGPCPPCLSSVTHRCHCGRKVVSLRCALLSTSVSSSSQFKPAPLSCEQPCNQPLDCGIHLCQKLCHPGPCENCEERTVVNCYCSAQSRDMRCGDGQPQICRVDGEEARAWEGYFQCEGTCNRPFNCGQHTCRKACHPPTPTPPECPFSTSSVNSCPCSHQTPLSLISTTPRTSCTDPIPTCGQQCGKPVKGCEHVCSQVCHEGPCKRCELLVEERCRCGRTGRKRACWEVSSRPNGAHKLTEEDIFMCDKKCLAMQNCGRHVCGKICCPLSILGVPDMNKAKRKAKDVSLLGEDARNIDPEGWHTCNLICNKPLSCGRHNCSENDHRGACPPCLQSSFEEVACFCGRTVLEPPIPCGTLIQCGFPCSRPLPSCGHPKVPHSCHEAEGGCPPCPFLTAKSCACSKIMVQNVRCSQEKVSCGLACGKSLDCGFHSCDRICHSGDCGPCSQTCGKSRKFCLPADHPCLFPCHAPATCPETEPCNSLITLTCACGRLSRDSPCGASSLTPAKKSRQLPCLQECELAKRNARLAEALGISPDRAAQTSGPSANGALYSEGLQTFFKANVALVTGLERTFAEFVTSDKRMMVLMPMPPARRKFVRELASLYRMDTNEVDQEPRRSVQLVRRIDTRIPPSPLSSSTFPPKRVALPSQKSVAASPLTALPQPPPTKSAWNSRAISGAPPGLGRSGAPPTWTGLGPTTAGPASSTSASFTTESDPATRLSGASEVATVPDEWDQDDF